MYLQQHCDIFFYYFFIVRILFELDKRRREHIPHSLAGKCNILFLVDNNDSNTNHHSHGKIHTLKL